MSLKGRLESFSQLGVDFEQADLAHHHLQNFSYFETFHRWRDEASVSTQITGAWNRPIFRFHCNIITTISKIC